MSSRLTSNTLPMLGVFLGLGAFVWLFFSGLGEAPLFHLGVALTLLAIFGVIWLFGIRYPDVGWMVVIATLIALDAGDAATGFSGAAQSHVASISGFALMLAYGAFLLAFFRSELHGRLVEYVFVGAVGLFAAVDLLLSPEQRLAFGLLGPVQAFTGAMLMLVGLIVGTRTYALLPPKRRRYVAWLIVATTLGAVAYSLQARSRLTLSSSHASLLNDVLASVFALLLLADLVVFHRDYFKDKLNRMTKLKPSIQAETREELGRAVQELLLPREKLGVFGDFSYDFNFQPASDAGGDWLFVWQGVRGECRLLFGQVQGQAAQMALGVAAMISLLHECKNRQMPLVATARYLNVRLIEIFAHRVTSSFMAVSIASDGTMEVFNAGGTGFFQLSRDGLRHHPMSSTPLGVSENLELEQNALALDDSDLVFACTAGILSSSAHINRVLDYFEEELDLSFDVVKVRNVVLKLSDKSGDSVGDKTLLTIQKLPLPQENLEKLS